MKKTGCWNRLKYPEKIKINGISLTLRPAKRVTGSNKIKICCLICNERFEFGENLLAEIYFHLNFAL
jgi:hypothetical protein